MITTTTTHTDQFNDACNLLELQEDVIGRIRNFICEEAFNEEILEEFFNNSQAVSLPLVVNWTNLIIHIWLELD